METIDAKKYGLSSRTKLVRLEDGAIGVVKMRKSRIIMKDGRQILDTAQSIQAVEPDAKLVLLVSGPVCSKTLKFLEEHNIAIQRHYTEE